MLFHTMSMSIWHYSIHSLLVNLLLEPLLMFLTINHCESCTNSFGNFKGLCCHSFECNSINQIFIHGCLLWLKVLRFPNLSLANFISLLETHNPKALPIMAKMTAMLFYALFIITAIYDNP